MIYENGKRRLSVISILHRGRVNDICICRDVSDRSGIFYTLLVIKEHETVLKIVRLTADWESKNGKPDLEMFSDGSQYCLLFEYRQERPISRFFAGIDHLEDAVTCLVRLVETCILAQRLPAPFLYLILVQKLVQIGPDGELYFTYGMDLEELDESAGEEDCTLVCAGFVLELAAGTRRLEKRLSLVDKKLSRQAYRNFAELYRDLKVVKDLDKESHWIQLLHWFMRIRGRLFKLFLCLCLLIALLAFITLLSQLLTGDVAWFKFLFHTFDQIGTETLR